MSESRLFAIERSEMSIKDDALSEITMAGVEVATPHMYIVLYMHIYPS